MAGSKFKAVIYTGPSISAHCGAGIPYLGRTAHSVLDRIRKRAGLFQRVSVHTSGTGAELSQVPG